MAQQPAMFWEILTEIQRGLREDVAFAPMPGDSTSGIAARAIVIRKLLAGKDGLADVSVERPGWLIVPGTRVMRPAQGGENTLDEAFYTVMCQLVAGDPSPNSTDNLHSYLKWQEQCARYLSTHFASYPVRLDGACAWHSTADAVGVIDPKLFVQHRYFVAGVQVTVQSREEWGASQ